MEVGWIRQLAGAFRETVEQAHATSAQAIAGVHPEGGGFTASQVQFPDMIVYVIRFAEARIRGDGERKRIAGVK
jgi:hypothetical protein